MSPFARRFRASQIIIITNVVDVSSVGIQRADCAFKGPKSKYIIFA